MNRLELEQQIKEEGLKRKIKITGCRIYDRSGYLEFYPEIENNYLEILKKLDIDFIMIPDELMCCGAPAFNEGYVEEFVDHKDKVYDYFKKHGATKIITSCPTCFGMLKKKYDYK